MAETKWTPGPWMAYRTGRTRSGLPEYEIHWSEMGECVAEVVHGEYNAGLISAAPALYEALKEMVEMVEAWEATRIRLSGTETRTDLTRARTALAQARGESHD